MRRLKRAPCRLAASIVHVAQPRSTQTEQGFAFGRRLLGLPRFRENPAAGQFQEYVSLTRFKRQFELRSSTELIILSSIRRPRWLATQRLCIFLNSRPPF